MQGGLLGGLCARGVYLWDTTLLLWHGIQGFFKESENKPNSFEMQKASSISVVCAAWAYLKGFCLSPALFTHSRGTQMAVGVSMVANHTLTPLISTETPSLVTKV